MVSGGEEFQPLRRRLMLRAAWTLYCATWWSLVSRGSGPRRRRRRRIVVMAAAGYLLLLFGVAAATGASSGSIVGAVGVLVAAGATFYLAAVGVLARAALGRGRRVWTNGDGSLVVTARLTSPVTMDVTNLAGWPVGGGRARKFLQALCQFADDEQLTVTARAGHRHLFDRVYASLGFALDRDSSSAGRPRMRRIPASRADT